MQKALIEEGFDFVAEKSQSIAQFRKIKNEFKYFVLMNGMPRLWWDIDDWVC